MTSKTIALLSSVLLIFLSLVLLASYNTLVASVVAMYGVGTIEAISAQLIPILISIFMLVCSAMLIVNSTRHGRR